MAEVYYDKFGHPIPIGGPRKPSPNKYTGEAAGAPALERVDPYQAWRNREGPPQVGGVYLRDMRATEVGPWPRKGNKVKGALCYMDGDDDADVHIVELAPGASTDPEHHLYDEAIYILKGRGATTVWFDEKTKQSFEWGEGSFFALPTNAWFQFFNGSGSEPARYFSITNLPVVLRHFHSEDFVFNDKFAFTDRYSGEQSYFTGQGQLWRGRLWETNFIPNVRDMKLWEWKERGGGGTNSSFMMAGGRIGSHVSRFQTGTYKKAHRHGPGVHLYIVQGEGYVHTQRGDEPRIRCDWQEGSMYLSGAGPGLWMHQHFNVGPTPAAYLRIGVDPSRRWATSRWNADAPTDSGDGDVSEKMGGYQREYEDEPREIHAIFEEELRKRGVPCRMKNLVSWCTGIEGPTQKGEWGDEK